MKLTENQFDRIAYHIKMGRTIADVAYVCKVSERVVLRVREAGTWERWPYIVAKATHGYNTPEYHAYLKRRGLPATPPAKMASREIRRIRKQNTLAQITVRRSLLDRLLRRW
jgi:hypothetical protein